MVNNGFSTYYCGLIFAIIFIEGDDIMSLIGKLFKKKDASNPEAIKIILDFVEGRFTFDEFWDIYSKDEIIINELRTKSEDMYYLNHYFDSLEVVNKIDISNITSRVYLFRVMERYLRHLRELDTSPKNDEHEYFKCIEDVIPEWLYSHNTMELIALFSDVDDSLPYDVRQKRYVDIIDSKFKCKNEKPYWLQPSEWPIIDNQPLLFIRQDGDPDNPSKSEYFDRINYYFLNEKTGEEVIITQFD